MYEFWLSTTWSRWRQEALYNSQGSCPTCDLETVLESEMAQSGRSFLQPSQPPHNSGTLG
ncbi:UNVERIFIED_CONTAM: hypothetical protein Sradi_7139800, partial [Sesamum radiatum]